MDQNWSVVHVAEPVWRHQHEPARQAPLQVFEALAALKRYRRGQAIYKEDSPVDYWYRIVSGMARRFSARADGKRQIVDLLLPGDVFGFGGSGKHHFAVEAVLDDTVVARFPCGAGITRRRRGGYVAPARADPQPRADDR
jgi:signal-transduction protein with cAMP-binding, CBS, and nucleotidyltransferase domain